jgi:hypothetical protein
VCALDMPVPPGSMARASMPTQERIEAAIRELL